MRQQRRRQHRQNLEFVNNIDNYTGLLKRSGCFFGAVVFCKILNSVFDLSFKESQNYVGFGAFVGVSAFIGMNCFKKSCEALKNILKKPDKYLNFELFATSFIAPVIAFSFLGDFSPELKFFTGAFLSCFYMKVVSEDMRL